ncbi:MAG: hypothetical protein HY320_06810, partial [Armatimonadetes bacterium]|nr:hypothetical protein [Armatimonadota bacterium]
MQPDDLERFTTACLQRLGAELRPLAPQVARVRLPDAALDLFEGAREVTLAFQPEAAQAHTDALLVAVGSYALDRLLEHLRQQPAAVVGAL